MFDIKVYKDNDEIIIKFEKNYFVYSSLKKKLNKPIFNPKYKYWTVSADQEDAVIAWVEWVKKELIIAEVKELRRLNESVLDEIQINLKQEKQILTEIEQIKEMTILLNANKADLAKVKTQVKEAQQKLADNRNEMQSVIGEMIDLNKLRKIADIMSSNMNYKIKGMREKFELAQKDALSLRKIVREAGYWFDALERIAGASFNRPDRDNPRDIPESAWYKIVKQEE